MWRHPTLPSCRAALPRHGLLILGIITDFFRAATAVNSLSPLAFLHASVGQAHSLANEVLRGRPHRISLRIGRPQDNRCRHRRPLTSATSWASPVVLERVHPTTPGRFLQPVCTVQSPRRHDTAFVRSSGSTLRGQPYLGDKPEVVSLLNLTSCPRAVRDRGNPRPAHRC